MPVRSSNFPLARLLAAALLLTVAFNVGACHESPQVVKIGLVAPFEGRYRSIGYEIIPAVRLAIREFAQENGGIVTVELVAYDDSGEPNRASLQAQKLIADPQVHAVIGHWRDDTTRAALDIYDKAGITVITYSPSDTSSYKHVINIAPTNQALNVAAQGWTEKLNVKMPFDLEGSGDIVEEATRFDSFETEGESHLLLGGPDWGLLQFEALTSNTVNGFFFVTGTAFPKDSSGDFWSAARVESFNVGFEEGAAGSQPGIYSATAYEAAWLAIDQVTSGIPELSGMISFRPQFDSSGRRIDAPIYLYQWQDGSRILVDALP